MEINDFTLAEALPLAEGLGGQAVQALTWVFQYTGGHPYLNPASMCISREFEGNPGRTSWSQMLWNDYSQESKENRTIISNLCEICFPHAPRMLAGCLRSIKIFESGKRVTDDERSLTKSHLKLSGLVRSEKGILKVRNEIYNSVFNLQWVRKIRQKTGKESL